MIINKRFTASTFLLVFLAISCAGTALGARRSSPMAPPSGSESVADTGRSQSQAANDVEQSLREILTAINEGKEPSTGQIDIAQEHIQQAQRYIRDFEEGRQAEFFMLTAWVKYYQGDLNRAAQAAGRALQIDPENNDVKSTYIAMAVMNDESLETLAKQEMRKQQLKKRGRYKAEQAKSNSSVLSFEADNVLPDVIGKKISRTKLHCLNSATLEVNPSEKHYCVLIWQYKPRMSEEQIQDTPADAPVDPCDIQPQADIPSAGRPGHKRDDENLDRMQEQIDQFANWYIYDFMNPRLAFFALNNDSYPNRTDVIRLMTEIPMPWPTVMLDDPANRDLELNNIEMPPATAGLAIVNNRGTIIYAGPATGQIPNLILQDLVILGSDLAAENQVPDESTSQQQPTDDQNNQIAQGEDEQPNETFDPDANMAPEEKFDAEKKINTAEQLIKAGRFTGYKRGIELCRDVMEKWPNSTYAQQARQLLNQIPERYHKRYGITDEELGR